jgi:hypothetical protein
LLDLALESGHVIKPKNGWYQKVDMETGEILEKSYRMNDTYNFSFWHPILQDKKFNEFIESKYRAASQNIMQEDTVEDVYEDLEEE